MGCAEGRSPFAGSRRMFLSYKPYRLSFGELSEGSESDTVNVSMSDRTGSGQEGARGMIERVFQPTHQWGARRTAPGALGVSSGAPRGSFVPPHRSSLPGQEVENNDCEDRRYQGNDVHSGTHRHAHGCRQPDARGGRQPVDGGAAPEGRPRAPRKPMPVTICAATRAGSPTSNPKADMRVKSAAPIATNDRVRSPAGLSACLRSYPMAPP